MLPDIPALNEFVPEYEAGGMNGIGVSRNTPIEIVNRLNTEINSVLADGKTKVRFAEFGATPLEVSAVEFGRLTADETEKWAKVIRAANMAHDSASFEIEGD